MVAGVNGYCQKNSEAGNPPREGTVPCEEATTVLECVAARHARANKEAMKATYLHLHGSPQPHRSRFRISSSTYRTGVGGKFRKPGLLGTVDHRREPVLFFFLIFFFLFSLFFLAALRLNLNSFPPRGPMPMQFCVSSSTTSTVTHSFTTEYIALALEGHPAFARRQTTVLRVLSDFFFFDAEGEFASVRLRPVLHLQS